MKTRTQKQLPLLVFFLVAILTTSVDAQTNEQPNIGFSVAKGAYAESADQEMGFQIGIRMHQLFTYSQPLGNTPGPVTTSILTRRARLLLRGHMLGNKMGYFIQLGMDKGTTSLMNAEYRWKPDKYTQISFGQFLLPLGREEQTASKVLQMIDRSNMSRFFWLGWDMGINLKRTFCLSDDFALKTAVALTHGEGRNVRTASGGWAYLARIDLLPMGLFHGNGDYSESDLYREPTPKVSFGAGYYFNKDAYTMMGNNAWDGLDDNFNTIYLDFTFKYLGASMIGEYISRNVDNEILTLSADNLLYSAITSGDGLNIQGGKFITETLEPTFRLSILNPADAPRIAKNAFTYQTVYSLGLNNFFLGHTLKLQSEIGYVTETYADTGDANYFQFLIQFGISF